MMFIKLFFPPSILNFRVKKGKKPFIETKNYICYNFQLSVKNIKQIYGMFTWNINS